MLKHLAAMMAVAAPLSAQPANAGASIGSTVSAAVPSVRFAHVRLRTGVRLHYAEQGDPRGEPLILLHGLGDSWYSFSGILPRLPASFRVFAIDQRGHGDSDRPASGYTLADLGDDVVAFMEAMEITRAAVIGHSMGSFVAQRVALTAPERVSRLVLVGSATTAVNDVVRALHAEVGKLPEVMPLEFVMEFQTSMVSASVPQPFMDGVFAETQKVPARVMRGALDGLLASGDSARLGSIRAPTLVIWGDRDAVFGRDEQLELYRSIGGAELQSYPGIGHSPHWEAPDRFVNDLLGFIQRRGNR
jgi:pimeloyl-ACP methyl ester carboxylesterase